MLLHEKDKQQPTTEEKCHATKREENPQASTETYYRSIVKSSMRPNQINTRFCCYLRARFHNQLQLTGGHPGASKAPSPVPSCVGEVSRRAEWVCSSQAWNCLASGKRLRHCSCSTEPRGPKRDPQAGCPGAAGNLLFDPQAARAGAAIIFFTRQQAKFRISRAQAVSR